jgi:hypothetical protein
MGHRRHGEHAARSTPRIRAVGISLATVALLLAACSGPSSSPGIASLGSTTTTSTALGQTQDTASPADYAGDVAYAGCMRAHGEPNFPDPNAQGDFLLSGGLRPNSPQFISANKSCEHLEPNGGVQTAADQREALAIGLKVSACMRNHGVANFPDPNSQGDLLLRRSLGVSGEQMSAAMKACQSLFDQFGAVP